MTAAARQIVSAFDALPDADREAVLTELLSRGPTEAGPLPDVAFEELADELFRTYDDAEAADAAPPG